MSSCSEMIGRIKRCCGFGERVSAEQEHAEGQSSLVPYEGIPAPLPDDARVTAVWGAKDDQRVTGTWSADAKGGDSSVSLLSTNSGGESRMSSGSLDTRTYTPSVMDIEIPVAKRSTECRTSLTTHSESSPLEEVSLDDDDDIGVSQASSKAVSADSVTNLLPAQTNYMRVDSFIACAELASSENITAVTGDGAITPTRAADSDSEPAKEGRGRLTFQDVSGELRDVQVRRSFREGFIETPERTDVEEEKEDDYQILTCKHRVDSLTQDSGVACNGSLENATLENPPLQDTVNDDKEWCSFRDSKSMEESMEAKVGEILHDEEEMDDRLKDLQHKLEHLNERLERRLSERVEERLEHEREKQERVEEFERWEERLEEQMDKPVTKESVTLENVVSRSEPSHVEDMSPSSENKNVNESPSLQSEPKNESPLLAANNESKCESRTASNVQDLSKTEELGEDEVQIAPINRKSSRRAPEADADVLKKTANESPTTPQEPSWIPTASKRSEKVLSKSPRKRSPNVAASGAGNGLLDQTPVVSELHFPKYKKRTSNFETQSSSSSCADVGFSTPLKLEDANSKRNSNIQKENIVKKVFDDSNQMLEALRKRTKNSRRSTVSEIAAQYERSSGKGDDDSNRHSSLFNSTPGRLGRTPSGNGLTSGGSAGPGSTPGRASGLLGTTIISTPENDISAPSFTNPMNRSPGLSDTPSSRPSNISTTPGRTIGATSSGKGDCVTSLVNSALSANAGPLTNATITLLPGACESEKSTYTNNTSAEYFFLNNSTSKEDSAHIVTPVKQRSGETLGARKVGNAGSGNHNSDIVCENRHSNIVYHKRSSNKSGDKRSSNTNGGARNSNTESSNKRTSNADSFRSEWNLKESSRSSLAQSDSKSPDITLKFAKGARVTRNLSNNLLEIPETFLQTATSRTTKILPKNRQNGLRSPRDSHQSQSMKSPRGSTSSIKLANSPPKIQESSTKWVDNSRKSATTLEDQNEEETSQLDPVAEWFNDSAPGAEGEIPSNVEQFSMEKQDS